MVSHDIGVVSTLDGLANLRDDWNTLWENSDDASSHQRWEWNYNWVKTSGEAHKLYVLSIRDQAGRLVGIAPLLRDRPLGLQFRLSFISQDASVDPDFIIENGKEEEVVGSILDFLYVQGVDVLDLVCSEPSKTISLLRDRKKSDSWSAVDIREYSKRNLVRIGQNYDDYLLCLGNNMRTAIRYAVRKLNKLFSVGFSLATSEADFEERMGVLLHLNGLKWKIDPQRAYLERRECYRVLFRAGMANVFTLVCDGQPIGAVSALIAKKMLWVDITGFDFSFAKVDLGKVFYNELFQWAISNGIHTIDFGSGEEPYKLRYRPELLGKWRLILYRNDRTRSLSRFNAVYLKSMRTLKHRVACSGAYRLLRGK
jgi:hypothetical protein